MSRKSIICGLLSLISLGLFSPSAEARARVDINAGISNNNCYTTSQSGFGLGFGYRQRVRTDGCPRCYPATVIRRVPVIVYQPTPIIVARKPGNYDRFHLQEYEVQPERVRCPQQPYYFDSVYNNAPPEQSSYVQPEMAPAFPSIVEIYDSGKLLQLSDGSLWQVQDGDKKVTNLWTRQDKIEVSRTNDRVYPFQLTNSTNSVSVKAVMKAAPRKEQR